MADIFLIPVPLVCLVNIGLSQKEVVSILCTTYIHIHGSKFLIEIKIESTVKPKAKAVNLFYGYQTQGQGGKHSQSKNEEAIAKDHDKDLTDDVPDILKRRMRRLRRKRMQNSFSSAQQLREVVTPPSVLRIQLSPFLH